jgi:hypothetical protein
MKMKAKTYGIKILVASYLRPFLITNDLKSLYHNNHKQLVIKKFIPYVFAFILILNIYKQGVLSLHFHI